MSSKRRNRFLGLLLALVAVGWLLQRRYARAVWADELRMLDWPEGPGPAPRRLEDDLAPSRQAPPASVGRADGDRDVTAMPAGLRSRR